MLPYALVLMRRVRVLLPFALFVAGLSVMPDSISAQAPVIDAVAVQPGELPVQWQAAGPRCMEVAPWQVHEYNPAFLILRQSGCTDYEKPFVYLIFGKEHALLYDTGSRKGDIVPVLARTMHAYLERNGLQSLALYIVHSHAHGDHTAGDKELQAWSDPAVPITFVPATVEDSKRFYAIASWPEDTGHIDLGGRVLDAIAIPGHEAAGVALYDRLTGVLLTGDSVYPGRLYIADLAAYTRSNERLLRFTEGKPVAHVLGCHIEQKRTPFQDYPVGTIYQPEEHALELSRGILLEIREGLQGMNGTPRRVRFGDFTLWPSGPQFRPTPDEQQTARAYRQSQVSHKWDQTKP